MADLVTSWVWSRSLSVLVVVGGVEVAVVVGVLVVVVVVVLLVVLLVDELVDELELGKVLAKALGPEVAGLGGSVLV